MLGARLGRDAAWLEGCRDLCCFVTRGAEILREHLALLREGNFQKLNEGGGVVGLIRRGGELQLVEARLHSEAQDCGVDLGRRRESFGRQREEVFDTGIELRGGREQAVVADAGMGSKAVGDLALNHNDGAVDCLVRGEEVEQDVGSDVVGQIADDEQLVRILGAEGTEVGSENVLLEDFDVGLIGELGTKARGEIAVEFDGDEATSAAGEDLGDGSAAWTDFDNGAMA